MRPTRTTRGPRRKPLWRSGGEEEPCRRASAAVRQLRSVRSGTGEPADVRQAREVHVSRAVAGDARIEIDAAVIAVGERERQRPPWRLRHVRGMRSSESSDRLVSAPRGSCPCWSRDRSCPHCRTTLLAVGRKREPPCEELIVREHLDEDAVAALRRVVPCAREARRDRPRSSCRRSATLIVPVMPHRAVNFAVEADRARSR